MSQFFTVHPSHPQSRLLNRAAEIVTRGGLVVYPTDTAYALGCRIGDKGALERIVALRRLDKHHQFTLACSDLRELGVYARVDNASYRLLKRVTPGPFTFVLQATREVPKRLQNPKRRTIGIRVPDHRLVQVMLAELGEPIMSSTLSLPGDSSPLTDPQEIEERIGHQIEAVIDAGPAGIEPTTVLDLSGGSVEILRVGRGDVSQFT